jgi:N-acetylmuramoyl-L-alanine amidase
VLAHGDVAPTRKVDPSRFFPWRRLAQAGFGMWCDTPPASAPAGFDATLGLRALGYDTTVAAAARAAFRRHFLAEEGDQELAVGELALLHCLLSQPRAVPPPTASGIE